MKYFFKYWICLTLFPLLWHYNYMYVRILTILYVSNIFHPFRGHLGASKVALVVKNLSDNAGDAGLIPVWGKFPGVGNGNPLRYSCLQNSILCTEFTLTGEGMATHSSIRVWKIPWTEKPGRRQSMGLQRVRHDWAHRTTKINILRSLKW